MRRRDFLVLAGAAAALPRVALAQQVRVPRVAWLSIPLSPATHAAFEEGLTSAGYILGKTVTVETFTAPSNADLPAYVAKVVASRPDVIFAYGTPASLALKDATSTIPIVFYVADPIGAGLVTSFATPGANLTGVTILSPESAGKQLQIIKETIPSLRRLAALTVPADPSTVLAVEPVRKAALALGVEPVFIEFGEGQDFATQFQRVVSVGAEAAHEPASTYFNTNRDLLFDLYVRNRIPAMGSSGALEGAATPFTGMLTYGASISGTLRRAAGVVDTILKGAKPGNVPVELPREFDFAVNLDTARKIGLSIPNSILAQATLVVDEDWRAQKAGAK